MLERHEIRRRIIATHSQSEPSPRPPRNTNPEKSAAIEKLAAQAAQYALEKKGEDVKLFDLRKLTAITDFFLICTGSTDTHVRAIADHIVDSFENEDMKPWHVEGRGRAQWVLVDYVDFVVHVFDPQTREYYGLERLWGDAECLEFREETLSPLE